MKQSKFVTLTILAIFLSTAAMTGNLYAATKGVPQTKCPVLGDEISKDIYTDYNGKRIYFCCSSCVADFKKEPAKYMKILKDQGVDLEKTPKGAKGDGKGKADAKPMKHEHSMKDM